MNENILYLKLRLKLISTAKLEEKKIKLLGTVFKEELNFYFY